MGHEELIRSLKREADEQVRAIRDEAEKKAAGIREQGRLESGRLKKESERELALKIGAQDEAVLKEAADRARGTRLSAERALEERLYSLSLSCLAALRSGGDGKGLFRALYKELPDLEWELVEVNPEDLALASELFSGAEVRADAGISGGMRAAAENGRVCITNTYEKRLERSWEDMLPLLMGDVYEEISLHGASGKND